MSDLPSVAVVLATYKRPDLLRRCLDAVANQSVPASSYEVIVVDDGHTEDTRQVVMDFSKRFGNAPAFRYFKSQGTRGPAGARNRGWRTTQAQIIAFTDDDTVPAHTWLQEGLKAMSPAVAAVGGRIVVPLQKRPTDHERNTQGLEDAEFATANVFVWRHALVSVGGFDERFTRAWREDSDLHFTLMRQCGPVRYAPNAVVLHPIRPVPWGSSLRSQANVFFDALLYKKHPILYRLKIRPQPPWNYYLIVASTLLTLCAALTGPSWLAWAMCLPALVGIIGFAVQRLHGADRTPAHVLEMLLTSLAIPYLSVYWRIKGALHFKVRFV